VAMTDLNGIHKTLPEEGNLQRRAEAALSV
jgi:hypothetical protein